jgi:hypothetical protein
MPRLLILLCLACLSATAAEPARKLVPRPIPGLPAGPIDRPHSMTAPHAMTPVVTGVVSRPMAPANEPARILFVHRRDRLPAAIRQRLQALPAEPAAEPVRPAAATKMVEERPAAIRIIPKSEVPQLKPPPSP